MISSRSLTSKEASPRDSLIALVNKLLNEQQKSVYLAKVSRLSDKKIALANDKVARLDKLLMLHAKSLMMILDRVSFKQDKVEMSDAQIMESNQVHMVFVTGGPSFMGCLHKSNTKYLSGGFGSVAPANNIGSKENDPELAVKVMHQGNKQDDKTAQHEARYNRMMGRECTMFRFSDRPAIVMDWTKGEPLNKLIDQDELKQFSFKRRLQWLASLLEDLNKMHEKSFVHFDLQPKNMIVDTSKHTMRLIDFGISHRENPNEDEFEVGADMRDLAEHIIRQLFEPDWSELRSIKNRAIHVLYDAAKGFDMRGRCTSQQALEYCQQLLINFKNLDAEKLVEIQNATINRRELQVEDVIRGSERAYKL